MNHRYKNESSVNDQFAHVQEHSTACIISDNYSVAEFI